MSAAAAPPREAEEAQPQPGAEAEGEAAGLASSVRVRRAIYLGADPSGPSTPPRASPSTPLGTSPRSRWRKLRPEGVLPGEQRTYSSPCERSAKDAATADAGGEDVKEEPEDAACPEAELERVKEEPEEDAAPADPQKGDVKEEPEDTACPEAEWEEVKEEPEEDAAALDMDEQEDEGEEERMTESEEEDEQALIRKFPQPAEVLQQLAGLRLNLRDFARYHIPRENEPWRHYLRLLLAVDLTRRGSLAAARAAARLALEAGPEERRAELEGIVELARPGIKRRFTYFRREIWWLLYPDVMVPSRWAVVRRRKTRAEAAAAKAEPIVKRPRGRPRNGYVFPLTEAEKKLLEDFPDRFQRRGPVGAPSEEHAVAEAALQAEQPGAGQEQLPTEQAALHAERPRAGQEQRTTEQAALHAERPRAGQEQRTTEQAALHAERPRAGQEQRTTEQAPAKTAKKPRPPTAVQVELERKAEDIKTAWPGGARGVWWSCRKWAWASWVVADGLPNRQVYFVPEGFCEEQLKEALQRALAWHRKELPTAEFARWKENREPSSTRRETAGHEATRVADVRWCSRERGYIVEWQSSRRRRTFPSKKYLAEARARMSSAASADDVERLATRLAREDAELFREFLASTQGPAAHKATTAEEPPKRRMRFKSPAA